MIKLKNISKSYKLKNQEFVILNNLSLSVSKGEMICIMGPSGSGKSTILNILGMILKPNSGKYYYNDKLIDFTNLFNLKDYRGSEIGFVVQDFALIDEFSVKENFDFVLDKKFTKDRYVDVLKEVGLDDSFLKRYSHEMSGGQKQRVAIARTLLLDPNVIIADEPTGALDLKTSKLIMDILVDLKTKGKTIIIVSHDKEVAIYCDNVYNLIEGELKGEEHEEK